MRGSARKTRTALAAGGRRACSGQAAASSSSSSSIASSSLAGRATGNRRASSATTRAGAEGVDEEEEVVRHLFVYGTLRPDDVKGAPWTKRFREGMMWKRARVPSARLYADRYPFVVLSAEDTRPADVSKHADFVVGYVMYAHDHERFQTKIAEADAIEGYPSYYQRSIVEAIIEEQQDINPPSHQHGGDDGAHRTAGERVKCYIYHRKRNVTRLEYPVWCGDWAFVGLQYPVTPTDLLFRTEAGKKRATKLD